MLTLHDIYRGEVMDNIYITYWFWLTVVFALVLYYLPQLRKFQLYILTGISFFVYWTVAREILFILVFSATTTALASYFVTHPAAPTRKIALWMGVVLNMLLLVFFKYKRLLLPPAVLPGWFAADPLWRDLYDIALPVGISFYVFHGVSLIVDTYRNPTVIGAARGDVRFPAHYLKTLHYISFFPQVVAGPIAKGKYFYEQIRTKQFRDLPWKSAVTALVYGYFLKEVIANNLNQLTAPMTNPDQWIGLPSQELFWMMLGYSAQIFTDFAGYSLIAIGLARLFGYELPQNFNWPYLASSFSDFWRKWHMSLTSWLRDYLYIPLGGNRCGQVRTYLNIFVVMVLGGLWHGAEWRFAIWGIVHGLALMLERLIVEHLPERLWLPASLPAAKMTIKVARIVGVFAYVTVAWLFFRIGSVAQVMHYLSLIIHGHEVDNPYQYANLVCLRFLFCLTMALHLVGAWLHDRGGPVSPRISRLHPVLLGVLLALCFLAKGRETAFIYFQF